jgi:hypothetical protein
MTDNVINLNVNKTFPKQRELSKRIIDLIQEYDKELSNAEIYGILELVKMGLAFDMMYYLAEEDEEDY